MAMRKNIKHTFEITFDSHILNEKAFKAELETMLRGYCSTRGFSSKEYLRLKSIKYKPQKNGKNT